MSSISTGTIPYPLSDLEREFERHPIRRKSISWIELRFLDGSGMAIRPLSNIRDVQKKGNRPIGFIWHNPKAVSVTPKLIEWVIIKFCWHFEYNPIMWTASAYTAPKELQSTLLGMQ